MEKQCQNSIHMQVCVTTFTVHPFCRSQKIQILAKTMDYSQVFLFSEYEKSFETNITSERASQEEQNGANFSFIAPSSEELRVFKLIHCSDDLYHTGADFGLCTISFHTYILEFYLVVCVCVFRCTCSSLPPARQETLSSTSSVWGTKVAAFSSLNTWKHFRKHLVSMRTYAIMCEVDIVHYNFLQVRIHRRNQCLLFE